MAFVAVCMCGCAPHKDASVQERQMYLQPLASQFESPSKEFRTAPLWVWNTDVHTDDIDRMLGELKAQGFGGAFVHPRPGLETEYLSPEWFRLWSYALRKGKELDMDIWIYDENSYPSGFAGGHVPDEMPESYNQGTCLVGKRSAKAPKRKDCYMCLLRQGDTFADITSRLDEYQGKQGDYYVYTLGYQSPGRWTAGFPYVDLLYKGVTEKFIEVTMTRGYEQHVGDEFGKSIKGTFTDEPNIASPMGGHCRWTPDLFDVFKSRWGYDLRPLWPLLGEEVGDWRKVRHDYNATLLQMFIDRWAKPWYEYTERHGMVFTGHYWEHNWPDLSQGPDNMAMYAWHQMPAIDMLFNQFNDNDNAQAQFGNVRAVKELRSVANQKGYVRTLSETYGGGGWDVTLQDLKRLGDWEFALGVNFMNQHLSHMTITGARKYDYPPVFSGLSPWWQDYGGLNTYFARLSLMLSQGEQMNSWLVMEPTTSLWMHYTQVAGGEPLWKVANAFTSFITYLEKHQMEYDLGCEQIIADCGAVTDDGFRIGRRTYNTVVLPPEMTNIENSSFQLLKQFSRQGGRVIAFPQLAYVDGRESDELKQFVNSNQVTCLPDVEAVLSLYDRESTLNMTHDGGHHIYHHRRMYKDGELLFIVNSSSTETAEVNFRMPGKYLTQWDAMTGEIYDCGQGDENGWVDRSLTLHPAASVLYVISDKPFQKTGNRVEHRYGKPLEAVEGLYIYPLRDNAMTLDFCNLKIGGTTHEHVFYKEANSLLWKHFGMEDPWENAVQYKREVLQCDTFTHCDISVEYPLLIEENVDLQSTRLIVEKPELWHVQVNGQEVKSYTKDNLLDARMGDYDIGGMLKEGENTVVLHMDRMNIRAEVGPLVVTGNFAVKPMRKGFSLIKPEESIQLGTYTEQGYPMYAWEMCYRKVYDVRNPDMPHRVRLGRWNGTVAQVWVNGRKHGVMINPPYELDLTDALQKGTNEIEIRVIGSLANLYGPHYAAPAGIMGPWMWNGVKTQRAGAEYSLYPYGLEEDFVVE